MKHTGKTWRPVCAMVALCLSVCLPGCEMPPTDSSQGVTDHGTAIDAAIDVTAEDNADRPTADTPVGALIHRIDLPLEVSLEACWASVSESEVPLLRRGMWQINGLRIGVLHAELAPTFAQGLPKIHGESRAKLIGSPYPSPIRSTPRLIKPVVVDLTDPPKSPVVLTLRGGKLQLLAKITRDETGQAYLELTPHHYKPKADLVPRSPLEKQLDGQVFDELTTRLALTPDTAVVVGLYRPWLEPTEPEEAAKGEANGDVAEPTESKNAEASIDTPANAADNEAEQAEPEQPPIPNHLGKALMAGRRAGQDTQVIMVISLIDDLN